MSLPRRWLTAAGVAALGAVAAAGCGPTTAAAGPPITVAATLYPLAQAVAAIGGPDVRVEDLTVAGSDPRSLVPTPATAAALRSAAVVVEVGGGFQPAVEASAAGAAHLVSLAPRFGPAADGAWLDPSTMQAALPVIAAALTAADPRGRSRFANGERDYFEQLGSVATEYEDALSSCPRSQIAAADMILATVARRYRLHLHPLGTAANPSADTVAQGARVVTGAGIGTVLSEPWVPPATVTAVARQASVKVRAFDTAEAPPAGGWPRGTTYVGLLSKGLTTIAAALGCPSSTDSQN